MGQFKTTKFTKFTKKMLKTLGVLSALGGKLGLTPGQRMEHQIAG